MTPEQQRQLDAAHKEVADFTEKVKKCRESVDKAREFTTSPEVLDAQNQVGKEIAALKSLMNDALPGELKEAYAEIDAASNALDQTAESYARKAAEEALKDAGVEKVPEIPEDVNSGQVAEAVGVDPKLAEAAMGIGEAQDKLGAVIKETMDPYLKEEMNFSFGKVENIDLVAEEKAREAMLQKMADAGVEVTGMDVKQFMPEEAKKLQSEAARAEAIGDEAEIAKSVDALPIDRLGEDSQALFEPLMEANDKYAATLRDGDKKVAEAENELFKAEQGLEGAESELKKLQESLS